MDALECFHNSKPCVFLSLCSSYIFGLNHVQHPIPWLSSLSSLLASFTSFHFCFPLLFLPLFPCPEHVSPRINSLLRTPLIWAYFIIFTYAFSEVAESLHLPLQQRWRSSATSRTNIWIILDHWVLCSQWCRPSDEFGPLCLSGCVKSTLTYNFPQIRTSLKIKTQQTHD